MATGTLQSVTSKPKQKRSSGFRRLPGQTGYFGSQMNMGTGPSVPNATQRPAPFSPGPAGRTVDWEGKDVLLDTSNTLAGKIANQEKLTKLRRGGRQAFSLAMADRDVNARIDPAGLGARIAANSAAFQRQRGASPTLSSPEIAANVQKQAQLRKERGMGPRAFATAQRNQQAQQALMQRQLAMRDPRAFASLMAAREEAQAGRDIAGIRGGTERDVAGIGADVQREGFQSAEKIAGGDQDIRREGIQSGERTAIAQMGVTQSIAQLNAKTQLATKAIDEAVAAKGFASQEKISEARNKAETAISHARIAAENARARGDQEHAQKMFEQESTLREKLAQLEQSGRETVAEIETRPQMAQAELLKDPEYQQMEGAFRAAELSGAGTPESSDYLRRATGDGQSAGTSFSMSPTTAHYSGLISSTEARDIDAMAATGKPEDIVKYGQSLGWDESKITEILNRAYQSAYRTIGDPHARGSLWTGIGTAFGLRRPPSEEARNRFAWGGLLPK